MIKLQSTVHSQLLIQTIKITKTTKTFYKLAFGPAFLFFLLLVSSAHAASFNIALIDTGFCPDKIVSPKIKIEKVIDLSDGVELNCGKNFNENDPRFHGQMVLKEFLKFYQGNPKIKADVHLYPLVVFNKHGDQQEEYWKKAIEWVKKNNISFVFTASGFITNKVVTPTLPATWFVPSGRTTPQITKTQNLFPQNLAPKENLFLIGDFYDGTVILYDQGLLYQDKIDYYFPANLKGFKGTSRAVAEASARALNSCEVEKMRECLKKKKIEYIDNIAKRKVQTFQ